MTGSFDDVPLDSSGVIGTTEMIAAETCPFDNQRITGGVFVLRAAKYENVMQADLCTESRPILRE